MHFSIHALQQITYKRRSEKRVFHCVRKLIRELCIGWLRNVKMTTTIAKRFALVLLVLWCLNEFNEKSFSVHAICDRYTCPKTANCRGDSCNQRSCSADKTTCSQNCHSKLNCRTACRAGVERCNQYGSGIMTCKATEKCQQGCSGEKSWFSCTRTKKCDQECSYGWCNAICGFGVKNCTQKCSYGHYCSFKCDNKNEICSQICSYGHACNFACVARIKTCSQTNSYSDNSQLTCNSKKCNQVSSYSDNCQLTCNSEKCNQVSSYSDNSQLTCNSRKCNQACDYSGCIATCIPGVEKCTQGCSYGDYCNFTCDAGIKTCSQKCSYSHNCQLTCNSKKCHQVCGYGGCVATCGPDVEKCTQECRSASSKCVSYCKAKKCVRRGRNWVVRFN